MTMPDSMVSGSPGQHSPLIVGDVEDSHVAAVVSALADLQDKEPIVFDAPSLRREGFRLEGEGLMVGDRLTGLGKGRGWLRRYAPTMWGAGTLAGGLEAVTIRSFLGLVGSLSRVGGIEWLTPLERMLAAEDKLYQLQEASRSGARVPRTLVTSDGADAERSLGRTFVVKPLVGGYFWADDGPRAVYAESLVASDMDRVDFGAAPFLAQERIEAIEHLRVVTVKERAWCAALDAEGRSLDWREEERSHFEWVPAVDDEARTSAIRIALSLGLGYSSQDWIRDRSGLVFLDLNPGGQWLFLPPEVAEPATCAIAKFLASR
jgi:hypothetical protein